jgi:hypothetical protein
MCMLSKYVTLVVGSSFSLFWHDEFRLILCCLCSSSARVSSDSEVGRLGWSVIGVLLLALIGSATENLLLASLPT